MKCAAVMYAVCMVVGSAFAGTGDTFVLTGKLPAEVVEALGEPMGRVSRGDKTFWLYPKGEVEFRDGRVVKGSMMSDVKYAEVKADRERFAEAARQSALTRKNAPASKQAVSPQVATAVQQQVQDATTARFYRPFIRPEYSGAPHYNNVPVLFELAKWPPAMRKAYEESVEIPEVTGQRKTTYDTLIYELKKYPDDMLEETLRCIYMIRNIRGNGEGKDPVALSFYTEGIILEHTSFLHHEYAHQLHFLFHDEFPGKAFVSVSGKYEGYDRNRNVPQKQLWSDGYTSDYAMSSIQEDFAEFCSELYLQPVQLFTAMKSNPKLQQKFEVIRPFLEMVKARTTGDSAAMDEAYFTRFDRNRWKP